MGPRCPSCGFDSAEGALFCDFCKEPFRKPKSAVPPADEFKRLTEGLPKEVVEKLPPQLLLARDDKLPPVQPWIRYAAWAFLGIWIVAGFITAGIWFARYQARQDEKAPGTAIIVERR